MPNPSPFNDEKKAILDRMMIEGATNAAMAKELGVSLRTLSNWKQKASRKARRTPANRIPSKEKRWVMGEACRLWGEGLNFIQIGKELGLAASTVANYVQPAVQQFFEDKRDGVAASQYADLQLLKNELREIIHADHKEDIEALQAQGEVIDLDDSTSLNKLVERAYQKGRKNIDTKLMAIDRYMKILDREAKLVGTDADTNLNINHNVSVAPEAIELLSLLQNRNTNNVIDGELVPNHLELGNI